MKVRGRRHDLRRQTLGVAGLSAVASGTTALVLVLGSSQLSTGWLSSAPFFGSTATGRPVLVGSPPAHPNPSPASSAILAFTPAVNVTSASGPAVTTSSAATATVVPPPPSPVPPPPAPGPKPPPKTLGGGHDCAVLTGVLGHVATASEKATFRIWAARHGHPVTNVCAVVTVKGFAHKFGKPHSGHGHGHGHKTSQGASGCAVVTLTGSLHTHTHKHR